MLYKKKILGFWRLACRLLTFFLFSASDAHKTKRDIVLKDILNIPTQIPTFPISLVWLDGLMRITDKDVP